MAQYVRVIKTDSDTTFITFRGNRYAFGLYPDETYDEGGWISDDITIRSQVETDLENERFLNDFERETILGLIEELDLADEFDIPELLQQLEEYEPNWL